MNLCLEEGRPESAPRLATSRMSEASNHKGFLKSQRLSLMSLAGANAHGSLVQSSRENAGGHPSDGLQPDARDKPFVSCIVCVAVFSQTRAPSVGCVKTACRPSLVPTACQAMVDDPTCPVWTNVES